MSSDGFVPLDWKELPDDEMQKKALDLFENMNKRRTTRHFSSRHVPKELIETAIMCGSTAPAELIYSRGHSLPLVIKN